MSSVFRAIGSIFKAPKIKVPDLKPAAVPMPDQESPTAKLAARAKVAARNKSGRSGTIYSGGGGAYAGQNLGGTV